jgi:galactose-1-phosphate uridylyltransferase
MERLASVEKRLRDIYPHVTIIKNYGRLVGGSLVHGHQQIAATDVEPRRIRSHVEYRERTGVHVSTDIAKDADQGNLVLRRYPTGALSVSPWMRRPYEMVYTVDDPGPSYLFELSHAQLRDMATAMGTAIGAVHRLFPKIGREPAYNVLVHSGPGAGIYVAFLPYTQETGGFEHAGLYVCQSTPALCHTVLTSAILPE